MGINQEFLGLLKFQFYFFALFLVPLTAPIYYDRLNDDLKEVFPFALALTEILILHQTFAAYSRIEISSEDDE